MGDASEQGRSQFSRSHQREDWMLETEKLRLQQPCLCEGMTSTAFRCGAEAMWGRASSHEPESSSDFTIASTRIWQLSSPKTGKKKNNGRVVGIVDMLEVFHGLLLKYSTSPWHLPGSDILRRARTWNEEQEDSRDTVRKVPAHVIARFCQGYLGRLSRGSAGWSRTCQ